jgi:hypothetical protein
MISDIPEETITAIKGYYQGGRGSIQDYARIYQLTVPQVLEIVGETDLGEVEIGGDQIDAQEIGKNYAGEIKPPHKEDVPFSLN